MLQRIKRSSSQTTRNERGWDDIYDAPNNSIATLSRKFSSLSVPHLKTSRKRRQSQVGGWQFDDIDETRPGRVMPSLPKELWIEILALAGADMGAQQCDNGVYRNEKADVLSFSLVSKAWNTYSQPALYHTVHIRKSSQAKALALTLLSQITGTSPTGSSGGSTANASPGLGINSSFVPAPSSLTSGRHIRYLTLSTVSYDRCNPSDILVIISSARHLKGFCDTGPGGIRCPLLEPWVDWRAMPENLLGLMLEGAEDEKQDCRRRDSWASDKFVKRRSAVRSGGRLESLTWTCYQHLPLPLPLSPASNLAGFNQLRSLHLYMPQTEDDGFFPDLSNRSFLEGAEQALHLPSLTKLTLTLSDPILSESSLAELDSTPNTLLHLLSLWTLPALRMLTINTPYTLHHTKESRLGDGFWKFMEQHGRSLAVLEFGRMTRRNSFGGREMESAFGVSYNNDIQEMENRWIEAQVRDAEVEMRAKSSDEEPPSPNVSEQHEPSASSSEPSLASLTPNLRTFICSASLPSSASSLVDFEWDWTHPDWLAPHPLLPSHGGVRMIGIRDLGERVRGDWGRAIEEGELDIENELDEVEGRNPFFTLYHQLCSLLLPAESISGEDSIFGETVASRRDNIRRRQRERENIPFPSLKYIRDLDPDSDLLRRGARHLGQDEGRRTPVARAPTPLERIGSLSQGRRFPIRWGRSNSTVGSPTSFAPALAPTSPICSKQNHASHKSLLALWSRVLSRTRGGEVWLEDWRGWNLTRGNLERWGSRH
ncbi:hypothetical protein BDP27DRAFT_1313092 [Rhodocollybia butyracea]|uniref:F-box domain-containing protein n=1 Tax=Rhodocollybia butyracea TaxID=206335 RepID=A0A9P5UFA2_9AGAR|nr:hypothetical protein BDP27DRAFT_1313092 [Rhodocollybia butyracea]